MADYPYFYGSPEEERFMREHREANARLVKNLTAKAGVSGKWLPIETAPKDGTRILAYGKLALEPGPSIGTVQWCTAYGEWHAEPSEATEYTPEACHLTHWMPLPEPPQD